MLRAHVEGLVHGIGQLLDVVGIDEQSVGKFVGSAGKRTEDQDPLFIVASGDEFLGHEIHAVMQRSDQAKRGSAVETDNLLMGVVPQERNDRPPAADAKAAVDAVGFGADFVEKLFVTRNVCAAGSADLHQGEAALINGIHFQEAFDAAEALDDALGVVEAIDTDSEKRCFDAEFGTESAALFARAANRLASVIGCEGRDTDGIRTHARDMALTVDGEAVPFGDRFHGMIHGFQKIVAVRLNMKTDQVGAEQSFDKLALPWADAEHFRVGPGNVPENRDSSVGARFLHHLWKQGEVIVLRKKNG